MGCSGVEFAVRLDYVTAMHKAQSDLRKGASKLRESTTQWATSKQAVGYIKS